MKHVATLHFSQELVRHAVLSYWKRIVGWKFSIAVAMCGTALVLLVRSGDRSWIVGALAAVLFIAVLMAAMIYVVHLRNSLAKLRALGKPVATIVAEDATFTVESEAGSSTLPWSSVQDIWPFEMYWLVMFSRAHFMTLPVADMPIDMRIYIQERVAASRSAHVG